MSIQSMILEEGGGIIKMSQDEAKEIYGMLRRTIILDADEDTVRDMIHHLKNIAEI